MVCRAACIESGLVMRAVGDTMILSPPLVISREQVDELHEFLKDLAQNGL